MQPLGLDETTTGGPQWGHSAMACGFPIPYCSHADTQCRACELLYNRRGSDETADPQTWCRAAHMPFGDYLHDCTVRKPLSAEEWPIGLLPDAPCRPAPCGGKRQDERASHTRNRAHDPLGRPLAYTRYVSHIPSTLQHMCTFLQAWYTKRVTTFLSTASTMHELHTADRANHTPRASHTFLRARTDD